MARKRKNIDETNFIYGVEAGRILGISRGTFRHRIKYRKYDDIQMIRDRLGVKYLIHDVFRIAHPSANNKLIETMVYNWRLKKALDTKKKG